MQASLREPGDVAVDAAGNIFIDDQYNNRIRVVLATPPSFDVSASALSFTGRSGGAPAQPQTITVNSPVPGLPFSISANTNWIVATPQAGAAPGLIEIAVDPANLPAGTYQATLTVTSAVASPRSRTIAVAFAVAPGLPPGLAVDKDSLSFSFSRAGSARSQSVTVSNTGGGSLEFTAAAGTTTGGNWLSVSPSSGKALPAAPVVAGVTSDPTGLAPGTYSGQIVITAGTKTRVIPVTMTISDRDIAILLSQTGLTFSAVAQSGVIPPQSFGIVNTGRGAAGWSVSTSTLAGGSGWLSATPDRGSSDVSQPVPLVEVHVNAQGLAPGSYYGLVRVDAPDAANSPQVLTVALEVLPPGGDPGPIIQPTELIFTGVEGAEVPGSQDVLVYNISGSPKSFRSAISTGSDDFLLAAPPRDGTLTPDAPAHITVQPQAFTLTSTPDRLNLTLPPGVYSRELALRFSDGRVRSVAVKLIVAPAGSRAPGAAKSSRRAGEQCAPTRLVPAVTSLAQSFSVSAGWPVALSAEVKDDCGAPLDSGFVSVSFSNGDPPVLLQALKQGRWHGTWPTSRTGRSQVTLKVDAMTPDRALRGAREVSGDFRSSQDAPLAEKSGVVSAASYQPFVALAPGGIISIFGDRLAEGEASADTTPLPFTLAGAQVLMGGRKLPLFSAGQKQINAIVPMDLNVNTSQQLLIQRGSTYSRPVSLDVAPAQPAVFTAAQKPLIMDTPADGRAPFLVSTDMPARAGDTLVIYSAGLGVTTPAVPEGTTAPAAPLAGTREKV